MTYTIILTNFNWFKWILNVLLSLVIIYKSNNLLNNKKIAYHKYLKYLVHAFLFSSLFELTCLIIGLYAHFFN